MLQLYTNQDALFGFERTSYRLSLIYFSFPFSLLRSEIEYKTLKFIPETLRSDSSGAWRLLPLYRWSEAFSITAPRHKYSLLRFTIIFASTLRSILILCLDSRLFRNWYLKISEIFAASALFFVVLGCDFNGGAWRKSLGNFVECRSTVHLLARIACDTLSLSTTSRGNMKIYDEFIYDSFLVFLFSSRWLKTGRGGRRTSFY